MSHLLARRDHGNRGAVRCLDLFSVFVFVLRDAWLRPARIGASCDNSL